VLAASSLGVYGVIIAGWASNSKYPFFSALRAAAQMVSYEVSIGFVLITVVLATAASILATAGLGLIAFVPLIGLAFGEAGLVTLFTLISVHALVLLTAATVVFELAAARERAGRPGQAPQHMLRTVLQAVQNGILHPVPLPIIAGLLFVILVNAAMAYIAIQGSDPVVDSYRTGSR